MHGEMVCELISSCSVTRHSRADAGLVHAISPRDRWRQLVWGPATRPPGTVRSGGRALRCSGPVLAGALRRVLPRPVSIIHVDLDLKLAMQGTKHTKRCPSVFTCLGRSVRALRMEAARMGGSGTERPLPEMVPPSRHCPSMDVLRLPRGELGPRTL